MAYWSTVSAWSRQLLKPKRLAILEAVVIGLVAALAAVLLKAGVMILGNWRSQPALPIADWVLLPMAGLVGGALAGFVIERLAPESAGSGIPQVKAALAYVPIALNLRVAIAKLGVTLLTLSSGFALGRQGPTVQIGAALAAQLSRWVPASPEHQRQLIAAGAAAGLAAGFDAPIAGVMFVIEELLQDVSSLTLGTAILASFTGGVIARLLSGPSLRLGFDPLTHSLNFSVTAIPLFLLLGVLSGLLAAGLSRSILVSVAWVRLHVPLRAMYKLAIAGLISGLVAAALPPPFRESSRLQEFITTESTSLPLLGLALVMQFGLTVLACSVETPGGLFIPSLMLGAALGHSVGLLAQYSLHEEPMIYALAGMGAVFGACAKVPVTAIVIVFEMTANFKLVLPLMISVVTAYLVAERLAAGSLYTHLLAIKGITLDTENTQNDLWTRLTAADVMQSKVETLLPTMRLGDAIKAFQRSHHRGFPVVESGELVGIITESDLDKVAQYPVPLETPLSEMMTPHPITVHPKDSLSHVLHLLSHYKLSRLPVVEYRRLVGIITRSDILRVEADQLRAEDSSGPRAVPSYVVYQTCAPAIGRGRILVPFSNPQTAPMLLDLAIAIATSQQYEIECLQVILVPRHQAPSAATVNLAASQRLLEKAVHHGSLANIPIHTQVRVAHSAAQAILEAIEDRRIDLLLMGWKGQTSTPGRIFGDVVDTAIRQAECDVVLVKWGLQRELRALNRWLVPIAGGPNSQHAIHLLPGLVGISPLPTIQLCQIFSPDDRQQDTSPLQIGETFLHRHCGHPVQTTPVVATSVADAVMELAESEDVVVVGASRENLLQQALSGNIPEAIARRCPCTVMLVRKALD